MSNAARQAGVVPRRIHLVVAIDRLLVRLLQAAPGQWVVKGGYANQLRRPDDARFTEDLDLPGGGLRFTVVARLAGAELVRFKVDVSAVDVVVGDVDSYFSAPALERLRFRRSRLPVYPVQLADLQSQFAYPIPGSPGWRAGYALALRAR